MDFIWKKVILSFSCTILNSDVAFPVDVGIEDP